MRLSEAQDRAVFKVKIDIGDKLGAAPGDVYVVLREPTYAEMLVSQQAAGDAAKNIESMQGLLPALIVNHNLDVSDGVKASGKQVAEVICSSPTLFAYVVTTWQEALPLAKKSAAS